jgi:hypothetical protein
MYRRLVSAVKRALGLQRPGRNLEVFPDDVFIVSYPKSGNTWTRFLIANLVYPDKSPDFRNINELIPDPEALSKRHLAKVSRPRIIKTHQYFHPSYRKIIFVVRDPRDVAVSLYYFQKKTRGYSDEFPIDQHVKRFVSNVDPRYGSWGENVASWLVTRGNDPEFLLLRYEDILKDAAEELRKIADFLHIEPSPERLALAVERSSADNMRKLEGVQALLWSSTKDTRQDIPFVRAAKSGNWRTELPQTCVIEIERAWGGIMHHLGYPLLCSQVSGTNLNEILDRRRLPTLHDGASQKMV